MAGLDGLRDLAKPSGPHVVDITVDRDVLGHQLVQANVAHVGDLSSWVVDGEPVDEVAIRPAFVRARIDPLIVFELRGSQAVSQLQSQRNRNLLPTFAGHWWCSFIWIC